MRDQSAALKALASDARAGARGAVLLAGAGARAAETLAADLRTTVYRIDLGKRTGVKDAHDRYANLDMSALLARIEPYQGVALLATNPGTNIDPAFTRRLRRVIDYTPR